MQPVLLDVTDAKLVQALDGQLPETLDAVVNNAGIVVGGPVEGLPLDELRRQLEVNVIGQVAVTQAVLPRLRRTHGRVVFVSSLSGRIATPMTGAYNASKFGLEAIADAMRMELWPWNISVSVVEPAQTDTDMWRGADAQLEEAVAAVPPEQRDLYAQHIEGFRKAIPKSQKMASPADAPAITNGMPWPVKLPRSATGDQTPSSACSALPVAAWPSITIGGVNGPLLTVPVICQSIQ